MDGHAPAHRGFRNTRYRDREPDDANAADASDRSAGSSSPPGPNIPRENGDGSVASRRVPSKRPRLPG